MMQQLDKNEEETTLSKIEKKINYFKKKWFHWTFYILVWGLIIVFIGGVVNYYYENNKFETSLKIFGALQIWIAFALGAVATLFSIISMFLSFYNLELQKASEKESRNTLEKIKDDIISEVNKKLQEKFEVLEKNVSELLITVNENTNLLRDKITNVKSANNENAADYLDLDKEG